MKHIKLFEKFGKSQNISEMYYGGKYDFLGAYGPQEFDEYSRSIKNWEAESGKSVKKLNSRGLFMDMLNGNKSIALVESDTDLFFVVINNQNKIAYNVDSSFGHNMVFDHNFNITKDKNLVRKIESVIKENI